MSVVVTVVALSMIDEAANAEVVPPLLTIAFVARLASVPRLAAVAVVIDEAPENAVIWPLDGEPVVVTVPEPDGVAHVLSPRRKVVDDGVPVAERSAIAIRDTLNCDTALEGAPTCMIPALPLTAVGTCHP